MISLILIFLFLIPLCLGNFHLLTQFFLMLTYIYMLYSGSFPYFSKISYLLGIDSLSYTLILLTLLISSFMIISIIGYEWIPLFLTVNISLVFFLFIIFSSLDFLYIYISFEFILVPLVILILGWGYQPERLISGLYLFFYTLLVSLPLFFILVNIYMRVGSIFFDYLIFNMDFFIIHFILLIVFMVKLPMCFLHYWLPKAHVQAPVSGSIILAGLMLKIGGYGLIRSMTLFEFMYINYSYIWFSVSLVGSLIISIVCLIQSDIKCLVAYSSICHMGIVIIGLCTIRYWGLLGSLLLILGHGFCSSGLFYIRNLLYIRRGRRRFYINKGLSIFIPRGSIVFFMLCSFNIRCPPSLNFIRELIIIISILGFWSVSSFFFIFISFLCACFRYYLYSYSQHGLYRTLYRFSSLTLMEFLCLYIHIFPLVFFRLFICSIF